MPLNYNRIPKVMVGIIGNPHMLSGTIESQDYQCFFEDNLVRGYHKPIKLREGETSHEMVIKLSEYDSFYKGVDYLIDFRTFRNYDEPFRVIPKDLAVAETIIVNDITFTVYDFLKSAIQRIEVDCALRKVMPKNSKNRAVLV